MSAKAKSTFIRLGSFAVTVFFVVRLTSLGKPLFVILSPALVLLLFLLTAHSKMPRKTIINDSGPIEAAARPTYGTLLRPYVFLGLFMALASLLHLRIPVDVGIVILASYVLFSASARWA